MKKKNILFITNIASQKIGSFSMASIMAAQKMEIEFHIAGNFRLSSAEQQKADEKQYQIKIHQIDFERNPMHPKNLKAYRELVKLIKKENFDIIHCNTPVGGFYGRLAGKKCGINKIIYQAHGFHFFKGAPIKNWLFYYPVERFLAHYTDVIITINKEDFNRAKKFKLRNRGKVYYVPGVGIDISQYHTDRQCRIEKRRELGLGDNNIALISVGNSIERINYSVAIEAVANTNNPKLHYYICGQGSDEDVEKIKILAKSLNVERQIHFLGYRADIKELFLAADIFLLPAEQKDLDGLLMQAIDSGLPCIASKIGKNADLLNDCKGGILCESIEDYIKAIDKLANTPDLRKKMSLNNLGAIQHCNVNEISEQMSCTCDLMCGKRIKSFDYIPLWARKRMEINIPLDATLLISVGELNENKNHQVIIEALGRIKDETIHYILCGVGDKEYELKRRAKKLGIIDNIHFLGYRTDIMELMNASDIFVMPSFREGLSRSIMEAMASGLPCIVSKIRGNVDLIKGGKGGFLYLPNDIEGYAEAIIKLTKDDAVKKTMSKFNYMTIKKYDISIVKDSMKEIYGFS